ncbi:MAG TPA: hypothetical protein VFF52_13020 [Isosphaeraceae bacterium]|nr:hypothetical protein [Isosphaeraceae bacterium]
MRARSWMAALALLGGTTIVVGRGLLAEVPNPAPAQPPAPDRADTGKSPSPPPAPAGAPKSPATLFPSVRLNLVIAGLGREGCDVEVKPANPGCKFRTAAPRHVASDGRAQVELRDVELRGADHTCTMAITVREAGQAPKTLYRGFRLASRSTTSPASSASPASPPVPSVTCYLSTRLAEVVDGKRVRK